MDDPDLDAVIGSVAASRNEIPLRKSDNIDGIARVAGRIKTESDSPPVDLQALHAKIGQLTLENDFLEGALTKAGLLSAKR